MFGMTGGMGAIGSGSVGSASSGTRPPGQMPTAQPGGQPAQVSKGGQLRGQVAKGGPQLQTATMGQTHTGMGQTARMGRTAPQPFFRATLPKGFSMSPGQTMWGTVTGQKGGMYFLQFGQFTLTARANLPLSQGQQIQVAFQGVRGGQAELQLMTSMSFTRMSEADLTTTLTQFNMPANQANVQTAKGMVEFGIPLTSQNFAEVSRALAQLPRPATLTDMAACSFLKSCNIPLTTNNVMVMSNFIAQNPMLGAQLFELQYIFDRDMKKGRSNSDNDALESIDELPGLLGKYITDPSKQNRQKLGKNLKNLARESGIERTEYRGGLRETDDEWQLAKLMRESYSNAKIGSSAEGGILKKAVEIMRGVEQNLQAQQIINNGKPANDLAFYYMQIPLRLGNETVTAEVRMKYYDEEGRRVIDPGDTRIEFDVTTEKLGDLHFALNVRGGVIHLDVDTYYEEVSELVKRFIPTLQKNLEKIGYTIGRFNSDTTEFMERQSLVKREEFETLERVNVQA